MPNISSIELLLILVVALLVIGPERLPAAIRTASLWLGRFRRSFYKVKAEIEREINADEVRRQLHNESVLADIRDTKSEVRKTAGEARDTVNKIVNSKNFDPGASAATEEQVRNAAAEREAAATGAGADKKQSESESGSEDTGRSAAAAEETVEIPDSEPQSATAAQASPAGGPASDPATEATGAAVGEPRT